ncbi:unnamed protein product [Heterobilharzia americana]|nr:unnamed protein product [Heterobilharzia americana]
MKHCYFSIILGSETQLLRLDIVNGLLRIFLHLPISEVDVSINSIGENDEGIPSHIRRKSKLSSLFQLDTIIQSHLDPISRLDDNQWHYIIVERTNSMLKVYIDNDLVFTRLIRTTNQYVYILHTQAIFQADAIEMNILQFTLSSLHGFRIQSMLNTSIPYDNQYKMVPINFVDICHYLEIINKPIDKNLISNKSDIINENNYITLKLPVPTIVDLLYTSTECNHTTDKYNHNSIMDKLRWIHLKMDFSLKKVEQYHNGLIFLLRDDTDNRMKHFSSINNIHNNNNNNNNKEQLSMEYNYEYPYLDGNLFIAGEYRNTTLYIIIQKDKDIWFEVQYYNYNSVNWLYDIYNTIEIKYTLIWLSDKDNNNNNNNNHIKTVWPLVKLYNYNIKKWITIGWKNKTLDVINFEEEFQLLHNFQILDNIYKIIWENTLWFGRTLYLNGMNYTQTIENGLFIPSIHNINGIHQYFQGKILRLSVNGLLLNLQSAIQARSRYLQSIHHEKISQAANELYSPSVWKNNSYSQMNLGICCSNQLSCSKYVPNQWGWKLIDLCRCHSTHFQMLNLQNGTPMMYFNGLQTVRLQFPVQQYSPLLWIQFMLQTSHLNGTLLYTKPESQYEDSIIYNLISTNGERKQLLDYKRKLYFHHLSLYQQQKESLRNEYDFFGTSYQQFQIVTSNGHIHLKYFVDKKKEVIELPMYISDGKWHYFEMIQNNSHMIIHLDQNIFHYRINLTISRLPIQQIIIGSANTQQSSSVLTIQRVVIKSLVTLEELHTCYTMNSMLNCYNNTEMKPINYDYPIRFKQSKCYLSLFNHSMDSQLSIKFSFKSFVDQGILLFISNKYQNDSFLLIELFNGHIHFSVYFNMKVLTKTTMESQIYYNDTKWHTVEVFRPNKQKNIFSLRTNTQMSMDTFSEIQLPEHFNIDQYISSSVINIGGCSSSDYIRFRKNINSREVFRLVLGCIANFQLSHKPTINLLQSAQILPNLNCIDQIVPNCELHTFGCALMHKSNAYSYKSNFYNLETHVEGDEEEVAEETFNEHMCYNDGKCFQVLNKFYCVCDLTTFQGHQCNEVGTTLHFGKVNSFMKSLNLNETLMELDQVAGFVHFQIESNHIPKTLNPVNTDILIEIFSLGIQLELLMTEIADQVKVSSDYVTLLYASTGENIDLTYLHVYLEQGYLKMKFHLDGSMIVIDGPKVYLYDGYYHRIRGMRSSNQVLLEVDQYHTIYRLYNEFNSLLNIQDIWLGHSPLANRSDFIRGYLIGVYYNGLKLTDLAAGLKYLTFVKVTRYSHVDHINKLQLKLGPNSPFYTESSPRKVNKQMLSKSSSTSYIVPMDSIPFNLSKEICSSCIIKKDYYWSQTTLSSNSKAFVNSQFYSRQFIYWLFICLILTGLLLITSFGFLIYRCTHQQNLIQYNDEHIHHNEQLNITSEINLLQSQSQNDPITSYQDKQKYNQQDNNNNNNSHFSVQDNLTYSPLHEYSNENKLSTSYKSTGQNTTNQHDKRLSTIILSSLDNKNLLSRLSENKFHQDVFNKDENVFSLSRIKINNHS